MSNQSIKCQLGYCNKPAKFLIWSMFHNAWLPACYEGKSSHSFPLITKIEISYDPFDVTFFFAHTEYEPMSLQEYVQGGVTRPYLEGIWNALTPDVNSKSDEGEEMSIEQGCELSRDEIDGIANLLNAKHKKTGLIRSYPFRTADWLKTFQDVGLDISPLMDQLTTTKNIYQLGSMNVGNDSEAITIMNNWTGGTSVVVYLKSVDMSKEELKSSLQQLVDKWNREWRQESLSE